MKFVYFIFLSTLVLDGCAFNSPEIGKDQENFSNFFLCFPEIDEGFDQLNMKEQLELRKEIAEEKIKRNFDCSQFSNFVSIKENVDKINEESHAISANLNGILKGSYTLDEKFIKSFD